MDNRPRRGRHYTQRAIVTRQLTPRFADVRGIEAHAGRAGPRAILPRTDRVPANAAVLLAGDGNNLRDLRIASYMAKTNVQDYCEV